MEQEITHYSRGKLHVGQITVRESALAQNNCLKLVIFLILVQYNNTVMSFMRS
jgi:hypothetical protein